jgi:hypothetical protein
MHGKYAAGFGLNGYNNYIMKLKIYSDTKPGRPKSPTIKALR